MGRGPRRRGALIFATAWLAAPGAGRAEPPTFERDVRPLVARTCLGCHGERKPKGGINLKPAQGDEAAPLRMSPDLWGRVAEALDDRSMPPQGKPAPSEEERSRAVLALREALDAVELPRDPGPGPIQRLTRSQYNNTIRDLLGVDTHPADAFPADGGGGSGFDNNGTTLFVSPLLMERYLAAASQALDRADPSRWLIARPGPDLSAEDAARRCLEAFASKAFRRPAEESDLGPLLALYRRAAGRGEPFERALRPALRAVLVSPKFLFLAERAREVEGPYRVDDYELASRLSYFLWSAPPDAELAALAGRDALHDPAELDRQVRRMLADPRARALAEGFVGQWLRTAGLSGAEPDAGAFPQFTPELRAALIEEPLAFFRGLLAADAPVLDLLDSDYAYLNETLARHYGIDGVAGPEFRRVALPDHNRGGVLGMGAVLTSTSYPLRTSPVLRGKWVLEELLGTPPPPPPPMIKSLPQDDRPKDGLSFRRRLEQHRADPSCASCHAKMDPLGFGLENFDAIGRWRTEIAGQPVDASGTLVGGGTFAGPVALKTILLATRKDQFVRNLSSRMLSYALRRGLEPYDNATVKGIVAALAASGYRGNALIAEVVKSYPFQYRRNAPSAGGP